MHRLMLTSFMVALCAANAQEGLLDGADGTEAITRPSDDRTLAFVRSGLVGQVLVADGDRVEKGQVLVQLDNEAEKVQVEQLRLEAEDQIRIDAAVENLELKKVERDKVLQARRGGAATELEVRSAEVSVRIQELTLDNEKFQKAQDGRKYQESKLLLDRMKIVSPIKGRVEALAVRGGEGIEAYEKIIRVVQIDPLWIDVPVGLARAREKLVEGQTARVAFTSLDGQVTYGTGKVIKIGSVADAASGTLNVRVEIPNPAARPAGEHVKVTFPPVAKRTALGERGQDAKQEGRIKER